jgi:predicted RNA-binding Zn-ribbon protein involved in translation (DUF1610 family)
MEIFFFKSVFVRQLFQEGNRVVVRYIEKTRAAYRLIPSARARLSTRSCKAQLRETSMDYILAMFSCQNSGQKTIVYCSISFVFGNNYLTTVTFRLYFVIIVQPLTN